MEMEEDDHGRQRGIESGGTDWKVICWKCGYWGIVLLSDYHCLQCGSDKSFLEYFWWRDWEDWPLTYILGLNRRVE